MKKTPIFLKILVGFIVLLFIQFSLNAQTSQWMQQGGGDKPDEAYSISTDNMGNTFTTGYFTGSASFGHFNLNTIGVSNVFITKTNANGVYQWAVQAGGNGQNSRGLAIKTDGAGNCYITGWYYGIATFGTFTLTSTGKQDVFVAKYNSSGTCIWAISGGGNGADIGNAISIDNNGFPVVTGEFQDTAVFGSFTPMAVGNNVNVFTAKLDPANGNFLWVKSGTGPHTNRGLGIACDPSGNVYVEGSFTDTITFDVMHTGNIYNAIFLIKYNSSGHEVWFTTAAGSTYGIANAIATDANNHIYLTGDFQGTLTFFWHNRVTTLTHRYYNRIFVCKYDTAANLLWDTSDASSNFVTSRNIAVDNYGHATIIGQFRCVMNSYSDRYGQGIFNSAGLWDVFVASYNSLQASSWQWSQQIGGDHNNYGWGVAVDNTGDIYTCGSFDDNMFLATGSNYMGYNSFSTGGNPPYCSDPYYGSFQGIGTHGNLDAFIAKPIDINRLPYDYYSRSGNNCLKPYVGVCASGNCQDTVAFCVEGELDAQSNAFAGGPGPDFTYRWSTGSNLYFTLVNSPGWYYVTQTSLDSCFTSSDSVYVIIHPQPPVPTISDNVVINTNAVSPLAIVLCRDSVLLTGGNYGHCKYYWQEDDRGQVNSDSLWFRAPDSNYCSFVVIDSFGCANSNTIKVILDSAFKNIGPKLFGPDSVALCVGNSFDVLAYDSITNPSHNGGPPINPAYRTNIYWNVTPNTINYSSVTNTDDNTFGPSDSGWYHITATIVRQNTCDTDTHVVNDSVYVTLHPNPQISLSVTGGRYVCPGGIDSALLIANCNYAFSWFNGSTSDSIWVSYEGYYDASCTVTNRWGCTANATAGAVVDTPPQPQLIMSPANGLICPNDSVYLHCSGVGTFQWKGPLGPFGPNQNVAYGNVPGLYYCVLQDTNGCTLLSNTVILEQYTTPFLWAYPSPFVCPGNPVTIHVGCSPGAIIQWQAPFSGNDTMQTVTQAGTYTCIVVSCGITTYATITIGYLNIGANITAINPVLCGPNDSATLSGDPGMAHYLWTPGNYITRTIVVRTPGTDTLTITDSGGCVGTSTFTVKQGTPFRDSIIAYQNVLCHNNNTGSITVGVLGGIMPFTYQWSPSVGNTATVTGLSAGTYTVHITDSSGCTATLIKTITQPLHPLKDVISSNPLLCCNSNTGTAGVNVSGGSGGYTYLWTPGGQTGATATGLTAGTYTVSITDSAGCGLMDSVLVTQPACITLADSVINADCRNNDGQAIVYASGGTGNYTYLWNPGGQTTSSVTGLSSGSYTATVTDSNGCNTTLVVIIGHSDNEHASINVSNDSTCRGASITLTASGGQTYLWSNGATTSSIPFTNDSSATWWTICYDGICADTIVTQTYCYPQLQLNMPKNRAICLGQQDTIGVTVAGGKPPYTYVWNNGNSANNPGPFIVTPVTSSNYSCYVTDGCNYNAKDSVIVTVVPPPIAVFNLSPDTAAPGDTIHFTNQSTNANSYMWTFGDGNTGNDSGSFTYSYQHAGNYLVVLTAHDSVGCTDTASKYVYIVDKCLFPNIFTPNGDGKNDDFMIKISEAKSFHCQIRNRWGDIIYEWDDMSKGWDGTIMNSGELAPEGEYFYIIDYTDKYNTPVTRHGIVSLIR